MTERRGNEPARFVRYSELDPQEAARMRAMVARAEDESAATNPSADAGPVRYAIGAGALPGNSAAVLVLTPQARTIVLAPDGDDRVLAMADAALNRVEGVAGHRLVLIARDGSFTTRGTPGRVRLDLTIPVSTQDYLTRPMRDLARSRPTVEIAGVGPVHFVD